LIVCRFRVSLIFRVLGASLGVTLEYSGGRNFSKVILSGETEASLRSLIATFFEPTTYELSVRSVSRGSIVVVATGYALLAPLLQPHAFPIAVEGHFFYLAAVRQLEQSLAKPSSPASTMKVVQLNSPAPRGPAKPKTPGRNSYGDVENRENVGLDD